MYFFFFSFFKIGPKLKDPPPKIHPPKPETGTSEVLFVPEYNTWGGGGGSNDPPSPQTDHGPAIRSVNLSPPPGNPGRADEEDQLRPLLEELNFR